MDLNKKYTYDKLTNETIDVGDILMEKMPICSHLEASIMAAILVASQHSREDLSYSYEVIGDELKTKIPGQKMKEYRLSHGLSQEQLAKQLGISRPYMSEIESNKRNMSVKTIKNFTDKLDITLSDFFS